MHPALSISKTGLDGQQSNLAIISNNLANASTRGYKKTVPVFKDLMYQKVRQPGGQNTANNELPSGLMIGTGAKLSATVKDFSKGSPERTDSPLDIFINGRGFFQISMPDGTVAYTRDGSFQLNSSGQIVTAGGLELSPGITIPAQALNLNIAKDGGVEVLLAGQVAPTNVGNIQIVDFINPAGLEPIGENLYIETASSGTPTIGTPNQSGFGALEQNTLESSNVNVVEELIGLIETQRAYEMNTKSIECVNDELKFIVQAT